MVYKQKNTIMSKDWVGFTSDISNSDMNADQILDSLCNTSSRKNAIRTAVFKIYWYFGYQEEWPITVSSSSIISE